MVITNGNSSKIEKKKRGRPKQVIKTEIVIKMEPIIVNFN